MTFEPPCSYSSLADTDLMARVAAGEIEAFDELVRRWRKPLLRFFYPLTWSMDDAEDCAQATFLRLWRARDRYRPCAKFSTYLFQIAKRYWLNERARKNVEQVPLDAAAHFAGLSFSDVAHPVGHLLARYRDERVRRAIQALPEPQRMALILCHYEGWSQREAAEILEIPHGTVKSRLAAAFAGLRRSLADLVEGD
ncbi:MAG: sigma-70 family RNA polymerase sigma factor [Armatimonadetes bacterium]|nr:sigma-70 family RNA polymerase sigma factor [Armatimonadota bacterium]